MENEKLTPSGYFHGFDMKNGYVAISFFVAFFVGFVVGKFG